MATRIPPVWMLAPATVVAAACVALAAVPLASSAAGAPIRVQGALRSGGLSLSAGGTSVAGASGTSATLAKAGLARISLTISDARGTGAGWTLRLRSSRRVTIGSVSVACAPRSTCTLPRRVAGTRADVVLRAARDSGMGVMRLVVTVVQVDGGAASRISFAIA